MSDLATELEGVLAQLRGQFEIIPFLEDLLPLADVGFQPLPDEMQSVLASSPDYEPVAVGEGPVWLQLETTDRGAELVVYRAKADEVLYVLAPKR